MASPSGILHHYNIASMNTDPSAEAMELDSNPVSTPNLEAHRRYLDAKKRAREATNKAKYLKKEASTSEDAAKRYQAARLLAKEAQEEAARAKREVGYGGKKSNRPDKQARSDAMTGVKMSTTSGIKKKTKEKKAKVTKQPLLKMVTGTGVYGWSVNDGDKELDRDEVRAIQAKKDIRLLLPPPQMLEAEAASASGLSSRRGRAERRDTKKHLVLAAAAEELVEKVQIKRENKRMERGGGRTDRRNTLAERELESLEEEQSATMGKANIADMRKEDARRERFKAVGALEERTLEENTEIDDIAEKLGLVSMGRKRGK
ncbi:hypothetical protein N431DRAFT_475152 [Stipitochalara longipes BDJ]|nr:hypothetical protein N431DRAFT_475152 [Stipitochalara longipes BDJ]